MTPGPANTSANRAAIWTSCCVPRVWSRCRLETLAALSQAFEDSTIPFFVEARDWTRLPESFRAEIERDYAVVVRVG